MALTDQPAAEAPSLEWCAEHFDHVAPGVAQHLHDTLAQMRHQCPVTRSDEHGGFWVVTTYEDVMRVIRDWRTFSSADGVGLSPATMQVTPLPEVCDPPLQQEYKRLINPYFTPAAVQAHEAATRTFVTRMIDAFVEDGECEFMSAFARPFPGRLFFELILNAPADEASHVNELTTAAVTPHDPGAPAAWRALFEWIHAFVERRRREEPRGDVVDAILAAEISGRPITEVEVIGLVQLLILGGLDTTAGALGQFMVRFCLQPEIPALLRERPEVLDVAVEELLRLDGPFVAIGRKATADAEVGGRQVAAGERVLCYWASANRDESEFANPDAFDLDRSSNRHLAFGIGPHRCAGSNLARMNLRIAVSELTERLRDLRLAVDRDAVRYHTVFNRAPLALPIRFTPGPRRG